LRKKNDLILDNSKINLKIRLSIEAINGFILFDK